MRKELEVQGARRDATLRATYDSKLRGALEEQVSKVVSAPSLHRLCTCNNCLTLTITSPCLARLLRPRLDAGRQRSAWHRWRLLGAL